MLTFSQIYWCDFLTLYNAASRIDRLNIYQTRMCLAVLAERVRPDRKMWSYWLVCKTMYSRGQSLSILMRYLRRAIFERYGIVTSELMKDSRPLEQVFTHPPPSKYCINQSRELGSNSLPALPYLIELMSWIYSMFDTEYRT